MHPLPNQDTNPLFNVPPYGEITAVLVSKSVNGGCTFYVPTNSDCEILDKQLKENLQNYLDSQDYGNLYTIVD